MPNGGCHLQIFHISSRKPAVWTACFMLVCASLRSRLEGIMLPGQRRRVFDAASFDDANAVEILRGESFVET